VGVFRREQVPPTRRTATPPSRITQQGAPAGYTFAEPAPYSAPRALTAAAAQVRMNDKGEAEYFKNRRQSSSSAWQGEAWEYYDAIGEVKYAFNLVASIVSRIRLYAAVIDNPAETPMPVRAADNIDQRLGAAAERALTRLDSAYGGQAGLLRDAALNLSVTGECYLVQMPARAGSGIPESWDIRSVDEVQIDSKNNYGIIPRRDYLPGHNAGTSSSSKTSKGIIPLPQSAFVGRIWRAHPRFSDEADSSLRGLLDLCAELLLLNRTFRATARSRLNAGALYLPDGLSVAASADPNYPYDDETDLDPGFTPEEAADEFEDQLIDAMTTPIRDEDSASAVVPLIIRGPAELGDKIKQFKFERSFDPALAERSDRVLERILQGLDVPKDVITGLANVKYSNAMQIDESLYKSHIEPLMLLIADALTVVYLRPYLVANGFAQADVERLVVWYDPSHVATRNDRASDAESGFNKMAVSFDTWRRTHGFSEADAPSPEEVALRMIMEKGAITPELTEAVIGAIAPDLMASTRQSQQENSVAPIPSELSQLLQGAPPAGAPPAPIGPGDAAPPQLAEPPAAPPAEELTPPQLAEPT
jgi:hypothetical protein